MKEETATSNDIIKIVQLNIGPTKYIPILTIGGSQAQDIDPEKFAIDINADFGVITLSLKDDLEYSAIVIGRDFNISLDATQIMLMPKTVTVNGIRDSSIIKNLKILNNSEVLDTTKAIEIIFRNMTIRALEIDESCVIKSLSFDNISAFLNADDPANSDILASKLLYLKIPPNSQIQNLLIKNDDCFETLEIGDNATINSIFVENCRRLKTIIIGKNCVIGSLKISNCESLIGEMVFLENTKIHDIKIAESGITNIIFQSGCQIGMMANLSVTEIDEAIELSFETGCQIYHQGYNDSVRMIYPTATHTQKDAEHAIKAKFGEGVNFEIICPGSEISAANNRRMGDNCAVM
jgi:hypothetical protein